MRLARALAVLAGLGVLLAAAPAFSASPQSPRLSRLPLVEVAASGGGDTLAVLYSGDGGWATFDSGIASDLAKADIPVVGVSSLRYFWNPRTAPEAASDLATILDHYMAAWSRTQVILVGYSFGANALPAIVAALPPELRSHVRLLALVGAAPKGELKFQPGSWLNLAAPDAYAIAPVLDSLGDVPWVCLFGEHDGNEGCTRFSPDGARAVRMAGGHRFNGDHASVAAAIMKSAGLTPSGRADATSPDAAPR